MQHNPRDHGIGAMCTETDLGPCVKPNKQYFFLDVRCSVVKNCCLWKTWGKMGVTKQVCFSERIVFSGSVQALWRTGFWEQVGVMQCNLCMHFKLPLESSAHCDHWPGFHMKWSLPVNTKGNCTALTSSVPDSTCWLMLLTGSVAEVIYLSLWERQEQS